MRICPRCTKVLEQATVCEVKIEGCLGCGGAWFDNGELTDIAKRDPAALVRLDERFTPSRPDLAEREHPMSCPVCLKRLEPFEFKHFPGIVVKACHDCRGLWLDHGELTAIAGRLTRPGR